MSTKLVIIESPGKIKTLSGFLGSDYKVIASMGHIKSFQDTGKYNLGIDVDNNFETKTKTSPGKSDVVKNIKEAAKNATDIFICSDPDREGEAIAADLYDILPKKGKNIHRVTFNEITKKAVLDALSKPGKIDWDLVNSASTRAIVDRIMGYRLSAVVRSKLSAKSAGRVQSAALRIISEREQEIIDFVPETYHEIFLPFKEDKKSYKAQFVGTEKKKEVRIKDKVKVDKILKDLKDNDQYKVKEIDVKERRVNPKPPYTTSSFQQDMSAKINMAPKRAMQVAQSLYEGVNINGEHQALITYMRTDSTRLSDDFKKVTHKKIQELYGENYATPLQISSKKEKEGSQDAHEGIRPTDINRDPESLRAILTNDEFRVYELIWKRTMASMMTPAVVEDTKVTINNKNYLFEIKGKKTIFPGFQALYIDYTDEEDSKDQFLPDFKVGKRLSSLCIA